MCAYLHASMQCVCACVPVHVHASYSPSSVWHRVAKSWQVLVEGLSEEVHMLDALAEHGNGVAAAHGFDHARSYRELRIGA